MGSSIRRRLTAAFIGLAAAPLVLAGGILAWQSFRVQKAQALVFQNEVARRVATEIASYFSGLERELRNAVWGIQLTGQVPGMTQHLLEILQAKQTAFGELSLLDETGWESLRLSSVDVFGRGDLRDRSGEPEFVVPKNSGGAYYGPVNLDPLSGEPFMMLALPVADPHRGNLRGVLAAKVRFRPVWNLVGSQALEPGQDVYVVAENGDLLAHRNPSLVLRKSRLRVPETDGFGLGLGGDSVALAHGHVTLGQGKLMVIAEQQLWTALGLAVRVVIVVLGCLIGVFLVAGGIGVQLVKRIVRPIEELSEVARAIQSGDEEREAPVESDDEIGELARSFNSMTGRLRGTLKTLEAEVSERRAAEEALAAEKERLSVTLRSIGDGVIATDVSGRVALMNRVAEELTGWRMEEAQGQDLRAVFPIVNSKTKKPCENPVEKVLATGQVQALANHTALLDRDGRVHLIADSGAPIRDRESTIIGVVLVFRDVTAKERMEEEIARVQKVESISVLAGGIAHDFNNLLTAILGNVSLARLQSGPESPIDKTLAAAEAASVRARDLTQQLLTFSRGGAPVKKLNDMGRIVEEAARFACTGSASTCQVDIDHPELWPAEVDGGQIAQVVSNLVLNAVQAMPGGGTVCVRAENAPLERNNRYALPVGNYLRFSVQDQGTGISSDFIQRVFDPYFTTKQKGSGLGLAVCHSIVSQHDGHITVQSKLGEGTTFEFLLPASPGGKVQGTGSAHADTPQGQGKILVMDDEEAIRDLMVHILQSRGFEVESAKDGTAALTLYRQAMESGAPFEAVISDLTIPGGMGGREMTEHLLKIDPAARVLVSSGYANDPILANFREFGFRGVVAKPYRAGELYDALARVLRDQRS